MAEAEGANMDLELECPVCFENLLAPIYQCHNGHLLCRDCIPMIKTCPMCREDMPVRALRNRRMEKIAIARIFSCPNELHGCQDKNKHHPSDCEFITRNFCSYLGIQNCDDELPKKHLLAHLTTSHNISGMLTAEAEKIELFQTGTTKAVDSGKAKWSPHFILQADAIFFLITKLRAGRITWSISALGSETTASKYRAKIRLLSPDGAEGMTPCWKRPVLNLRPEYEEDPLNNFSLDIPLLKQFWQEVQPGEKSWKLHICIKTNPIRNPKPPPALQRFVSESIGATRPHQSLQNIPFLAPEAAKRVRLGRRRVARGIQQNEIHDESILCHCCKTTPIVGPRFKCMECEYLDLCSTCVEAHDQHVFLMAFTRNQKDDLQRMCSIFKEIHRGIATNQLPVSERRCDGCGEDPLLGTCHSCTICEDYDLCQTCVNDNIHNHHVFLVAYSGAALRTLQTLLALAN